MIKIGLKKIWLLSGSIRVQESSLYRAAQTFKVLHSLNASLKFEESFRSCNKSSRAGFLNNTAVSFAASRKIESADVNNLSFDSFCF